MKTAKLSRELKCGADLLRKSGTQPQTRGTARPQHSLVRSLFCAHPVAFVSHEGGVKKNNKRFYFHIFLPPHFLIHRHSQKKKRKYPVFTCSNCTCFTASSLQKNQTKQQNNKKKRKTGGKMSTGNTAVHGGSLCTS